VNELQEVILQLGDYLKLKSFDFLEFSGEGWRPFFSP
jgi:hypothetical protein